MTLVNTETGELVPVPPGSDLVPDGWAEDVMLPWLDVQTKAAALGMASAQLAGMEDAYRTLNADVLELAKARRYLEVRWGELLGEAKPGRPTAETSLAYDVSLDRDQRLRFRALAKAKTTVMALVRAATDADQVSRATLLKAVKQAHPAPKARLRIIHAEDPDSDVVPTEFPTIVIDPPWRYENVATRGAAEDHYRTMSLAELEDLELPSADNAHLYLWVTNAFLSSGFDLLVSWGFTYKTVLTWCKPSIGMGNYFRNNTEHVLFAVKGSLPTNANNIGTWFQAGKTKHSAKPESFYDLVEASSPGPYLEMFARRRRFRWHTWGNEA